MALFRQPIGYVRGTHWKCRRRVLMPLLILWCCTLSMLGLGYLSSTLRHEVHSDVSNAHFHGGIRSANLANGISRHEIIHDYKPSSFSRDLGNIHAASDGLLKGSRVHIETTPPEVEICDCLADPQLTVQSLAAIWLPGRASEGCRQRCASIRKRCENCSAVAAHGGLEDQADCAPMCRVHGSCSKRMALRPEQLTSCPAYDPSLRDERLALLRSLDGEVSAGVEHPGIEVRGLSLQAPEVMSKQDFWCALRYLIYDYYIVIFKDQVDSQCELDYRMCTAVADLQVATLHQPDTINNKVVLVSNHPQLGVNAIRSQDWHFDGRDEVCPIGIFSTQASAGSNGRTGFVKAAPFIRDMSPEAYAQWTSMRWRPFERPNETFTFPFLSKHPVTSADIVLLMDSDLLTNAGGIHERAVSPEKRRQMLEEWNRSLTNSRHSFNVTWAKGDVAFMDNCALLHRSLPDSFRHFKDVGLRVARKALCGCRMASLPDHAL
eukprot:jgi/Mesvir1/27248/Mv07089-RA.1